MENKKDSLLVGEDVNITGNIAVLGAVYVYGSVNGQITAQDIYIGETGVVSGEVKVSLADIKGEVSNSIQVKDILTIRSTGKVSGTISYQTLEIEQGGKIEGKIEKNNANNSYITEVQLESK